MKRKNYLNFALRRKLLLSFMCWCMTGLTFQIIAQTQQISGSVKDATNSEPLIGASISIQGTGSGTISDYEGNFDMEVPSNDAILVVSYTGYKDMEIPVGSQTTFDIMLQEDREILDEVVVVGYGVQKKRDVTGAISTLSAEKIAAMPVSSSVQAMQGQVAGVDIQSTGGRPGQAATIRIRGRRSISASNDPLFVIDGIPQTSGTNAIADINPQDISSMEVLKDAAATAIYGSRGANGVVIITTKRGSSGKTVLTYDGYFGTTSPVTKLDMMNTEQWANMRREAFRNGWDGDIPADEVIFQDDHIAGMAAGNDVDWLGDVLQNGTQTNHQLGMRGGTEKTQFNISLGYFNEEGIIQNMDYTRLSSRVNVDHKLSKIFKAGISLTVSNSTQNWGSSATIGEALSNVPVGTPYEEDGITPRFLPSNDGIRTNPLNEIQPNAYIDERKATRIFAPVYVQAKITDDLIFTSTFGPDVRFYRRGEFRSSLTNDNRGGPADAEIGNETNVGYTLENLLNYNKTVGKNTFGGTFLQSIQNSRFERHRTEVANLPYESQLFYNIGSASVKGNVDSRLQQWSLASFMGRANYSFDGKYMVQATLRADGSSRLSDKNKWNYFPGISVGWRIGEESFLDNANWLNDLKLRASYGEVGNTSVDPYQTAGRLQRRVYSFGEANAFGFGLNEIPNEDLTWEVSKTVDIGVDFDILNGKFSGTLDWYNTNTSDILLARNLPPTSGYSSVLQNIGATQTKGLEFGLSANILDTPGGFKFGIDFNIAGYKEAIKELALKDEQGNAIDDVGNGWFIGQPIRVYYDYNNIGIYQSNEVELANTAEAKLPGEIKLEDVDGDGVITADDRKIIGTDVPDYYGGITTRFEYQGFDLSAFFYYRQGQTIRSNFHVGNNSLFARYNNINIDYWTKDNPGGTYPRPNSNQESPRNNSTMGYFDGSYLKLRNVTLGYNLPSTITDKIGMGNLRFYVSGQNLWFKSKYNTFDPEVDDSNTENLPSLGAGTTPSTKVVLFGVRANF